MNIRRTEASAVLQEARKRPQVGGRGNRIGGSGDKREEGGAETLREKVARRVGWAEEKSREETSVASQHTSSWVPPHRQSVPEHAVHCTDSTGPCGFSCGQSVPERVPCK
eukprot:2471364-Rhodomonas_salina.2